MRRQCAIFGPTGALLAPRRRPASSAPPPPPDAEHHTPLRSRRAAVLGDASTPAGARPPQDEAPLGGKLTSSQRGEGSSAPSIDDVLGMQVTSVPTSPSSRAVSDAATRKTLVAVLAERQHLLRGADDGLESALKHEATDRIERRRSRPTISDTEFAVGMSERLFPHLPRLSALSEVHHSDCIVSCWDEAAALRALSLAVAEPRSSDALPSGAIRVDTGTVDDDENFLGEPSTPERSTADSGAARAALDVPAPAVDVPSVLQGQQGSEVDAPQDDAAVRATTAFAWQPLDGHVSYVPLTVDEIRTTFGYLQKLRGVSSPGNDGDGAVAPPSTWAELMDYLLGSEHPYQPQAPTPILPFSCPPEAVSGAPALVFRMYTENTSTQNALGHLAALFSVPQRQFITNFVASKMSSCTVLCAVASSTVTREQLLLLNTMRHPGFVLRVADIQPVAGDKTDAELFSEVARSQVVTEVSLLLRRVRGTKADIQKRLDALRDVGAIFYCANREVALVRAATDVLHGYYRSAFLNGLYRKKSAPDVRQFLRQPTVPNAVRARKVATDSTIRQVLKGFIRCQGNFKDAVQQVPYVVRRKWVNALRSHVWNCMASERMRWAKAQGRALSVVPGDLVLRPQYRHDAALRRMPNVKAEHLMVCTTEAEAGAASLEDVFIPFLRGKMPSVLFAPDATDHPIMTEAAMRRLLRHLHATHLLDGMGEDAKRFLDVRVDVAPLLFRRLLMRPMAVSYTVLEDRPPVRSVHYDAARQLLSPRLYAQGLPPASDGVAAPLSPGQHHESKVPTAVLSADCGALIDRAFILGSTTLATALQKLHPNQGGDDAKGHAAEDATTALLDPLDKHQYVVLGRAHRDMDGAYVQRAPVASDVDAFDRVYTVHLRALCPNGASALLAMLREYFAMGGILEDSASVLQHKIHRTRRELDADSRLLCAPQYCSACYNTCHDDVESCPEYLWKRAAQAERRLSSQALLQVGASSTAGAAQQHQQLSRDGAHVVSSQLPLRQPPRIVFTLRRRTVKAKWGIDINKELLFQQLSDAAAVTSIRMGHAVDDDLVAWSLETDERQTETPLTEKFRRIINVLSRVSSVVPSRNALEAPATTPSPLVAAKAALQLDNPASGILSDLELCLTSVNGVTVTTRRDVAAQLVGLKDATSMELAFEPRGFLALAAQAGALRDTDHQVQPIQRVGGLPHASLATGAEDAAGDGGEHHLLSTAAEYQALLELPTELTLILTRPLNDVPQQPTAAGGGWGLKVGKRNLALVNIAALIQPVGSAADTTTAQHHRGDAAVAAAAVTIPPLPPLCVAAPGGLLSRFPDVYRIAEANHSPAHDIAALSAATRTPGASLVLLLRKSIAHVHVDSNAVPPSAVSTAPTRKAPDVDAVAVAAATRTNAPRDAAPVAPRDAAPVAPQPFAFPTWLLTVQHGVVSGGCTPEPFTVAVHRSAALVAAGRWGLRLAHNTLRLKCIPPPHTDEGGDGAKSTSVVHAANVGAARAIADALQLSPERRIDQQGVQWLPNAFYVVGVKQQRLTTAAALESLLQSSTEESIALQCVRVGLPTVRLVVQRLDVASPWGMQLSPDAIVTHVKPNGAVGTALRRVLADIAAHAPSSSESRGAPRSVLPSLECLLSDTPQRVGPSSSRESPAPPLIGDGPSALDVDDDEDSRALPPATKQRVAAASPSLWADDVVSAHALRWRLHAILPHTTNATNAHSNNSGIDKATLVATASDAATALKRADGGVTLWLQQVVEV